MKIKKIVIDSNLWISFLISSTGSFLKELISKDEVQLLFSNKLISEIVDTALKEKFRKYFTSEKIILLIDFIRSKGKLISVKTNLKLCRDPKDNFLLNLSIDGNANFLITGDKDLLILKKVKNTQIVTLKQFEEIIKK